MSRQTTIKIDRDSFNRNPNRFIVNVSGIKERKTWKISPVERVHCPKKSRAESRKERKQTIRKAMRGELD